MATANFLEEALNTDVDESAVNAIVGSLETQLVTQSNQISQNQSINVISSVPNNFQTSAINSSFNGCSLNYNNLNNNNNNSSTISNLNNTNSATLHMTTTTSSSQKNYALSNGDESKFVT
jgi:transcription initiation factor TFIID subunit 4